MGLCCCVPAFSSCGEQGLLSNYGAQASPRGGFSCRGAQGLGTQALVVTACGLGSCSSWALRLGLGSGGAQA